MRRSEGDTDAAIAFLRQFHPNTPWVLVAIDPDRNRNICITKTFDASSENAAYAFIDKWNSTYNLYFLIAEPIGRPTKKPGKKDIARTRYLWVDIDPRAGEDLDDERARILKLCTTDVPENVPKPTCVVDSGRGYWCFWKMETPAEIDGDIETAENIELYNVELERRFGADSCHNIDRIASLPGTINMKTKGLSLV